MMTAGIPVPGADTMTDGVGVGVGVGVGDGVAETTVGVGVGDAIGVDVGVGVGFTLTNETLGQTSTCGAYPLPFPEGPRRSPAST